MNKKKNPCRVVGCLLIGMSICALLCIPFLGFERRHIGMISFSALYLLGRFFFWCAKEKNDEKNTEMIIESIRETEKVSVDQKDVVIQNIQEKEEPHHVTGIRFYLDNVMTLALENFEYDLSKNDLINLDMVQTRIWKYTFLSCWNTELIPEPENEYDSNAIKVMVGGVHIGYIKKGSCKHIHKLIRENRILGISCKIGGGPYIYISEEMDAIGETGYVIERGSTSIYAKLYIRVKADEIETV